MEYFYDGKAIGNVVENVTMLFQSHKMYCFQEGL